MEGQNLSTPQGDIIDYMQYGVDTRDAIRQALAGYLGGAAIASEMIQNADDAEASIISFHFNKDALVIKNNSRFSERDFENICAIASGRKRDEKGKIGQWGTGFLSVFHITDQPVVESSGKRIEFDPAQKELPLLKSPVHDSTIITLRWRREHTDLSQRMGAEVIWDEAKRDELKEDILRSAYNQIMFLRHVRAIEVYENHGDGDVLLCRVERSHLQTRRLDGFTRQLWRIERRDGARGQEQEQAQVDEWLYYLLELTPLPGEDSLTIKDYTVALALPRKPLTDQEPFTGYLYNFLPTPIRTGYAFHVNGAFFPDSHRRDIILNEVTRPRESKWNRCLSEGIARLFMMALIDIRNQVQDASYFYQLLPLTSPAHELFGPLCRAFRQEAPSMQIVYSTRGRWVRPSEVLIGQKKSKLPELAAGYMDILPPDAPDQLREFLKEANSRFLSWIDVLDCLRPRLRAGQSLQKSHPMINSRQKLYTLYDELPSPPNDHLRRELSGLALCLADGETLWPACEVWLADETARRLMANHRIHFLDAEVQNLYLRLFEGPVQWFRGAQLVNWLGRLNWPRKPFPLSSAPFFAGDAQRLREALHFIYQDLDSVDEGELADLPLVYGEDGLMYRAAHPVYIHDEDDLEERKWLGALGLRFVHPEWARDMKVRDVYETAGVERLKPEHVINLLEELGSVPAEWKKLGHDRLVSNLLKVYAYFERHANQLSLDHRKRLKSLPLCVNQQGKLMPAQDMHLPPAGSSSRSLPACLDKLQQKNLVHSDLVRRGNKFLREVLGLEPASPVDLIRRVILHHYHDEALDDKERLQLLEYIERQMQDMDEHEQNSLRQALREAKLVRCTDGQYRKACEVYFSSPSIDSIFGREHPPRLHPDYGVPAASRDDEDQEPYKRSKWYQLFSSMGVNEKPAPEDIVRTVREIVTEGPPTDERIGRLRPIYDLLNKAIESEPRFSKSEHLGELTRMRWLPARQGGGPIEWHLPSEVYQLSQKDFIGDQAPLLQLPESSTPLREFLRMPGHPPADIVARHVLAMAAKGEPLPRERDIFEDLGRRWQKLNPALQRRLEQEAVVWDRQDQGRYWQGCMMFLGDYSKCFGGRRGYRESPGGSALEFLRHIGVKERPDWRDHISLIEEIAREYEDDRRKVSEDDKKLLFANFDHLGGQIEAGAGPEHMRSLERLKSMPIVPGKDGILRRPDRIVLADRSDVLQQFEPGAVPVVDDSCMTEHARVFLRRLGVQWLSSVIQRLLTKAQGVDQDAMLTSQVQELEDAFRRIANTLRERAKSGQGSGGAEPAGIDVERLRSLRIYSCTGLRVEYRLDNRAGWIVRGHVRPEKALYSVSDNSLYVKCGGYNGRMSDDELTELALELERAFFPDSKQSSVIETLLKLRSPNKIMRYLDKHGYVPLYSDQVGTEEEQQAGARRLAGWDEPTAAGRFDEDEDVDEEDEAEGPVRTEVRVPNLIASGEAALTTPDGAHSGVIGTPMYPSERPASVSQAQEILDPGDQQPDQVVPAWQEAGATAGEPQAGRAEETDSEHIPPFTGRRRPAVPARRNDYLKLEKEFGLRSDKQSPDGPAQTAYEEASPQEDAARSEGIEQIEGKRVTQVKFVLSFLNRYGGFLPLHPRARQMLSDRPRVLKCQTDYEGWQFDLYVDYEVGVIYNEQKLPAFFDSYNIPAGGIVYLERVHDSVVRLFWKQADSRVEKVRCLEIGEDGKLTEFEIDAEYPCEISEYVLRAEKRLEDPVALFRQALEEPGLFQTMCEVFGKPGEEMTYDEIYERVMKRRMVAKASIDFQLSQRPCFVRVGQSRWRFEPRQGTDPVMPGSAEEQDEGGQYQLLHPYPQQKQTELPDGLGSVEGAYEGMDRVSAPAGLDSPVNGQSSEVEAYPAPVNQGAVSGNGQGQIQVQGQGSRDPYLVLYSEVKSELHRICGRLDSNGYEPGEQLREIAELLAVLARRLQDDLKALAQQAESVDDMFASLWRRLASVQHLDRNKYEQTRENLIGYLLELATSNRAGALAQVRSELARTSWEHRENIFFPLLEECASRAMGMEDMEDFETAKGLYELLREQGAGDFGEELERLEQSRRMIEDLALLDACEPAERWAYLLQLWERYPDAVKIRRTLIDELKSRLAGVQREVETKLDTGDPDGACAVYTEWLNDILPVSEVWRNTDVAGGTWAMARQIIKAYASGVGPAGTLRDGAGTGQSDMLAKCQQALELVARLPEFAYNQLVGAVSEYLKMAVVVAKYLQRRDDWMAAILIEYALQVAESSGEPLSEAAIDAHLYADQLMEKLGQYRRAYEHVHAVQQYWVQQKADYQTVVKPLSNRANSLHSLANDPGRPQSEQVLWKGQIGALLSNPDLARFLNVGFAQRRLGAEAEDREAGRHG